MAQDGPGGRASGCGHHQTSILAVVCLSVWYSINTLPRHTQVQVSRVRDKIREERAASYLMQTLYHCVVRESTECVRALLRLPFEAARQPLPVLSVNQA